MSDVLEPEKKETQSQMSKLFVPIVTQLPLVLRTVGYKDIFLFTSKRHVTNRRLTRALKAGV